MSDWREDPRLGRRVRIAPHRDERPNDFRGDEGSPRCPFCKGSEGDTPQESDRISDADGSWIARVVPNLFPAIDGDDGAHEVVIESPRHVTRFADLNPVEAAVAVRLWSRRIAHWRDDPRFAYQLVFKNEGRAAGASLEHVHSQVVALAEAPASTGQDAAPRPTIDAARQVTQVAGLVVSCPPAPRFALETWIEPLDETSDFALLSSEAVEAVAQLLQELLKMIGRHGGVDSLNLMVRSAVGGPWRIEIAPRSAAIAGFELATGLWINPVAPEVAAERIRAWLKA